MNMCVQENLTVENRVNSAELPTIDEMDNLTELEEAFNELDLMMVSSGVEFEGKVYVDALHKNPILIGKLNQAVIKLNKFLTEIQEAYWLMNDFKQQTDYPMSVSEKKSVELLNKTIKYKFIRMLRKNTIVAKRLYEFLEKEIIKTEQHYDEHSQLLNNLYAQRLNEEVSDYINSFITFHEIKLRSVADILDTAKASMDNYIKFVDFLIPQYIERFQHEVNLSPCHQEVEKKCVDFLDLIQSRFIVGSFMLISCMVMMLIIIVAQIQHLLDLGVLGLKVMQYPLAVYLFASIVLFAKSQIIGISEKFKTFGFATTWSLLGAFFLTQCINFSTMFFDVAHYMFQINLSLIIPFAVVSAMILVWTYWVVNIGQPLNRTTKNLKKHLFKAQET